jgi:hypothetical protein
MLPMKRVSPVNIISGVSGPLEPKTRPQVPSGVCPGVSRMRRVASPTLMVDPSWRGEKAY